MIMFLTFVLIKVVSCGKCLELCRHIHVDGSQCYCEVKCQWHRSTQKTSYCKLSKKSGT